MLIIDDDGVFRGNDAGLGWWCLAEKWCRTRTVVGRVGSCIVNFMICMPCLKEWRPRPLSFCLLCFRRTTGLMCFCISRSRESGTFSNLDWGQLYSLVCLICRFMFELGCCKIIVAHAILRWCEVRLTVTALLGICSFIDFFWLDFLC